MFRNILYKKQGSKYISLFAAILLFLILFIYDLKLFLFLTHTIKAVMGIVIMIIAINTYNISKNTVFTFLAISLGFCGLIEIESVLFSYYKIDINLSEYLYLQIFIDYLTLLSLILCVKLYDKFFKFQRVFLFYLALVFLFSLSLFGLNIVPSVHKVVLLNFTIKDITNFILFALSFYPLYTLTKIKDKLGSDDLRKVVLVGIFFIIAMFLYSLASFEKLEMLSIFASDVLLMLYTYFTFRIILKSVLKNPYNILFHDLDEKSKEVEKSKDYYKELVESLPVSTIILNNNKIVFVNLHTLNLFKYNSKLDLKYLDISSIVDVGHSEQFNENYYNKIESFETIFRTSSGDSFDASISQVDVCFDNHDCTLMLIKDISVKKRLDELNNILKVKSEQENIKTEFFSNLSHELRTPINVIYSVLQLEEMYIKSGDMESIEKHHKTLKQNSLRLLRICNNLIDVSKIDSGYFKPDMKCSNIVTLIEDIVSSVAIYTKSKNINIVFDTDNEELYALCDSDLIERVFLNLISNSIKYGSPGGNIFVDIYEEDENIRIMFIDDGPGIPKEQCDNMFERFTQADRSFQRHCEGSGLGLSLVKSLIEINGGTIKLDSDLGLGCTFTITIPKLSDYIDPCPSVDDFPEDSFLIDKINIEFSDIYL